ncbi:MAG: hypothetical protein EON59_13940 [Alphaproteobacteria bacterium]|nr:MAG: hypothetical protein EON59_13940 [Alphaproteobacteria bacterium]
MKSFALVAVAVSLLGAGTAGASAQGNSANAPGQDRVCLVQSSNGSFNDADVAGTKWLPRKAAEAQASKDPTNLKVFDYTNDPLVTNGTYASAEVLCNTHFAN